MLVRNHHASGGTEVTATETETGRDPLDWLAAEWAEGRNPSGAQLAREFGLGERRGQQIVKAARNEHARAHANGTAPRKPTRAKPKRGYPSPAQALRDAHPAPAGTATAPVPPDEPEPARVDDPEPEHPAAEPTAGRITRLDLLALGLVALAAVILSFAHQWHLASIAGEGALAWLLPLSVDGMVAVASRTMLARKRTGRPAKLATAALTAGVFASVGANIWGAEPTPAGWATAAWPPLAYLVAYELLLQQLHPHTPSGGRGEA